MSSMVVQINHHREITRSFCQTQNTVVHKCEKLGGNCLKKKKPWKKKTFTHLHLQSEGAELDNA